MLPAESAVLVHLKSVGGILFVFHCVVVALLALCACKSDLNSHNGTSIFNVSLPLACVRRLRSAGNRVQKKDLRRGIISVPHEDLYCQDFFVPFCLIFIRPVTVFPPAGFYANTKPLTARQNTFTLTSKSSLPSETKRSSSVRPHSFANSRATESAILPPSDVQR